MKDWAIAFLQAAAVVAAAILIVRLAIWWGRNG